MMGLVSLYAAGVRRGINIAVAESAPALGTQHEGLEDRQYTGSSFREVRDAVFNEPYYGRTWGIPDQRPLPVYPANLGHLAKGLFSLTKKHPFSEAARRTLESSADLRWGGPEKKGVQRLLHPNGICLAGFWRITAETAYTGFFAKGSEGRVIARYSTGLRVRVGEKRTLSMVGKLYPALNPDQKSRPASFITQHDLGAAYPESIYDAPLCNAPDVTTWKRGLDIPSLLVIGFTFSRVDMRNNIRQLYEIAELTKAPGTPTRCPQFMRLRISSPRIAAGDSDDFRDEVLAQMYDRGDPVVKRSLVFSIEVSDQGAVKGGFNKRLTGTDWKEIGHITFEEAAASYNGDFVIHFHHPKWRGNVNDPNSVTGPSKLAAWINNAADKITTFFTRH